MWNCRRSDGWMALIKICATEEVAARSADELAAAVFEARGAGGAEAGVMLGRDGALGGRGFRGFGCGRFVHGERLAQIWDFRGHLKIRWHPSQYGWESS